MFLASKALVGDSSSGMCHHGAAALRHPTYGTRRLNGDDLLSTEKEREQK